MERNELQDFRQKWLLDLHQSQSTTQQKKDPTVKHVYHEEQKPTYSKSRQDVEITSEKPFEVIPRESTTSTKISKEYEAFAIANKYLNTSIEENKPNSRKRKYSNQDDGNLEACSSKRKESLVDLLIADIDEITCIPFFEMELPKEIAVKVFTYLNVRDLSQCCRASKQWKAIAEDDLIWFNIYKQLKMNGEDLSMIDGYEWKRRVKDAVLKKRHVQQKWKERFCEVYDLEYEKGGILCTTCCYEDDVIVAYLDGSLKIWNLMDRSFGHPLKERHTRDEDIITDVCCDVKMSKTLCVASFQNGDVMVWRRDNSLSARLVFMTNLASSETWKIGISPCSKYISLNSGPRLKILKEANEEETEQHDVGVDHTWNWSTHYEYTFNEKILDLAFIDKVLVLNLRHKILTIETQNKTHIELDQIAGATFSCLRYSASYLVVAVNGFGYSSLGGFRIRKYCLSTLKELCNMHGSQGRVQCLGYGDKSNTDCLDDQVIVACSNRTIKIYQMTDGKVLSFIPKIGSDVTMLQFDEWKILSGHQDGSIVLWDRHLGTMYWKNTMKHPVKFCHFTDYLLTTINIPIEKFPRNSNWYADDLIQHRKYRGSIRVMNFTKDILHGGSLSKEFHADYDNITGYDYNIELIAPYDNVEALNLPKI
ncbi:F-box/WD repeat-containing protein 8-like [Clytia hemisphaerica]|uniref:F-box domain-containing protein n=1 Tax=Clytia hemisphaerica TaxID=252671 RepID=A0A7M5X6L4_9CNID|eukprot:TCONS_00054090-protein